MRLSVPRIFENKSWKKENACYIMSTVSFSRNKKNGRSSGRTINLWAMNLVMIQFKTVRSLLFLFLGLTLFSLAGFAAEKGVSYDRYTTELRAPIQQESTGSKIAKNFLAYPFEVLKWPMDQGLLFMDKYRLDQKTLWVYEKLQDRGIQPYLNVLSWDLGGYGSKFDFVQMADQRANLPDAIAEGWVYYNHDVNFDVGTKLGWDRIAGTGFRSFGLVKYEKRPMEHFFGIGPNTSRGDGYVYGLETTTLGYDLGYSPDPKWSVDAKFDYKNVNTRGGMEGSMGQIGQGIFTEATTPGFGGDEILSFGTEAKYDTRDQKENSMRGGLHRAAFSYNAGTKWSAHDAGYFKYEAEVSRYIRLGSDKRVLAARLFGELNSQASGHYVLFHQMARLGGPGAYPYIGQMMRGYERDRFMDKGALLANLEYRYNVWKYREFRLDTDLFVDEGEVFDKIGDFKFNNLRTSYGFGFRLSFAKAMIINCQLGFSEEGMNVYVESTTPF